MRKIRRRDGTDGRWSMTVTSWRTARATRSRCDDGQRADDDHRQPWQSRRAKAGISVRRQHDRAALWTTAHQAYRDRPQQEVDAATAGRPPSPCDSLRQSDAHADATVSPSMPPTRNIAADIQQPLA